jgi:hypothetical protein
MSRKMLDSHRYLLQPKQGKMDMRFDVTIAQKGRQPYLQSTEMGLL